MHGMAAPSSKDEILFAQESEQRPDPFGVAPVPWRILIVDDDPEVHIMTKLVLRSFVYRGRPLAFASASSGQQALELLRENADCLPGDDDDIAVILLDVVMETDDAGLRLVPVIRETLDKRQTRIILRTGQPGQAPEEAVIRAYDINDYKAKTELTAQRLTTTIVSALRSYEMIVELDRARRGLERASQASSRLLAVRPLERLVEAAMQELAGLMGGGPDGFACILRGKQREDAQILTAAGCYDGAQGLTLSAQVEPVIYQEMIACLQSPESGLREAHGGVFMSVRDTSEMAERRAIGFFHRLTVPLSELDRKLLGIMSHNITTALDNQQLYDQVKRSHKAAVVALAGLVERRDPEGAGDHALRLSRLVTEMALALKARGGEEASRVTDDFIDLLSLGAMLYDIGMMTVPERVTQKAGPLTEDERRLVAMHCEQGAALLEKAARQVEGSNYLSFGATIARSHQERWDGSGYPQGLSGTAIPLEARLVAIADVYGALTRRRSWREAVTVADAAKFMMEGAGKLFDPALIDIFFDVTRLRARLR
jgi:response regulator RpfG family c-di-GMP phosphodiesterase